MTQTNKTRQKLMDSMRMAKNAESTQPAATTQSKPKSTAAPRKTAKKTVKKHPKRDSARTAEMRILPTQVFVMNVVKNWADFFYSQ